MNALLEMESAAPPFRPRHSIRRLLHPVLEEVGNASSHWRAESLGNWRTHEGRYWLPRLVFTPRVKRPRSSSQSSRAFTATSPRVSTRCAISSARLKPCRRSRGNTRSIFTRSAIRRVTRTARGIRDRGKI